MQERLNETLEEMKKKLAELDKGDALKDDAHAISGEKGKDIRYDEADGAAGAGGAAQLDRR